MINYLISFYVMAAHLPFLLQFLHCGASDKFVHVKDLGQGLAHSGQVSNIVINRP